MADKEYFNDQGDPVTFIFKHGRRIPIAIKHVLSNDIRDKINRASIADTKLEFEYNRELFSRQLKTAKENNPHGWMVDQKSPEELKNCKMLYPKMERLELQLNQMVILLPFLNIQTHNIKAL